MPILAPSERICIASNGVTLLRSPTSTREVSNAPRRMSSEAGRAFLHATRSAPLLGSMR